MIVDKNTPPANPEEPGKKPQEKLSGMSIFFGLAFGICVVALIGYISVNINTGTKPKTAEQLQQEKIETRKKLVESQFSAWDGSHYELTQMIKKSMNDPKSYEHVETRFRDNGDFLTIKTTFRGKNTFGGVVKNWVMAKVDFDGNVIEILSQGP